MTTRRHRIPAGIIAALILFTATTSGCSLLRTESPYQVDDKKLAQLEEQVRHWPSLEDTEQHVAAAIQEIAQAITTRLPQLQFAQNRPRSQGGCQGGYGATHGLMMYLGNVVADGPIPDDAWPDVLADARRIAATYGITEIETRVDNPGQHNVRLYDDTWNEIIVGYSKATVISGTTGCRLKAADKTSTPN
jgi:hypothetical protein